MSTITFDTLKFVTRLEQAGVPREQAAAMAEAQKEVFAEALDTSLATKADVLAVKNDIVALQASMQAMELRLTIKLGAFIAGAVGILIAVQRLPH